VCRPRHRVTAAGGRLGGFSAPGGARTKRALLAIERARQADQGELFER
jgi:methylated-DNA-[protein]-cysteine S-methyltransferase